MEDRRQHESAHLEGPMGPQTTIHENHDEEKENSTEMGVSVDDSRSA
jgi:hypothetical protein